MTEFDLSSYNNKRDFLISNLNNISEMALSLGRKETVKYIKKSIFELKDEKFKIVVVGEFARGKSMFINALVGKRIFPSSIKPTTTILNKLSYSETPKYRLIFKNKKNFYKDINEYEFKNIIAPKEPIRGDKESEQEYENSMKNISEIAFADIGYPAELCQGGVEIIDTPGTNDLDVTREEITYKFIPESDMAIMILSATNPLAESEMNFLKDRILKSDIQKIYFVINFKDKIRDEKDELKIINYIREHLEAVVSNPKIFMVSSKGALKYRRSLNNEDVKGEVPTIESTGFIELEKNMSEFLANERGNIKLSKFMERAIRISTDLRKNSIAVSIAASGIEINELRQKINRLKREIDRVKDDCDKSVSTLKEVLLNRGLEIQNELSRGLRMIDNSAEKTVNNYEGTLSEAEILKAIENTVAPMQTDLYNRISEQQEEIIKLEVYKINDKFGCGWKKIDDLIINELILGNLGDSLNSVHLEGKNDKDEAYVKTGASLLGIAAFVGTIHLAAFAIPIAIFGGKSIFSFFKNENRKKVLEKVRKQVHESFCDAILKSNKSFNEQWSKNVSMVVENIKSLLDRKSNGIEQQLNSILQEKTNERVKVDMRRKNLLEMDKLIQGIINDLRNSSRQMTK